MLGRLTLHIAACLAWLCLSYTALAADVAPVVTNTIIAQVDTDVIVTLDGERLDASRVHRGEDGELFVDALPIFETLQNEVEFDAESSALIVRRSQDGVVMELFAETGIVKADGKALGRLKDFGQIDASKMLLSPNAIAVLAGAAGELDKENNSLDFELDPRLRITTGFEIIVNGVPIGPIQPQPKSVGPVLLLPLLPIAQELGHTVDVLDDGRTVRVERNSDSAVFTLDLDTGLVSLFGNPIGLSTDASLIDPVNLLLPVSALETLTGTRVEAGEGSQIVIDLDDRLMDAIAPEGRVEDIAAGTPLTVEYAEFQLGPNNVNRLNIGAHGGAFNGTLRAELGQLPSNLSELQPDWLSVDFRHVGGMTGSVGDNYTRHRELSGVGGSRFRGLSASKATADGRWSVVAGQPVSGARDISGGQSRLDFSGLVAGVRYADADGWESGLAVRHDPLTDDQRAVLSAISGRLGRNADKPVQWNASAQLGVFSGPARRSPIDIALRAQARTEPKDNVTFDAFVEYSGTEFTRADLTDEKTRVALLQDTETETQAFLPETRRVSLDSGAIGASAIARFAGRPGVVEGISTALRVSHNRSGVFSSSEDRISSDVVALSAAASIPKANASVSAGVTHFKSRADEVKSGTRLSANLYTGTGRYTLRGRSTLSLQPDEPSRFDASVTLSRERLSVRLPKEIGLTVQPNVTASYGQSDWRLRGGVTANINSGEVFGSKVKVSASAGVLQAVSGRAGGRSSQFVSVSVARDVRLGRNMSVGLGYRADMRGDHRLGLLLRGRYDFNAARRLKLTEENKGLLQGSAFLDANGDGVRQPDEMGAGGVVVRLQGTPYALRTDASGSYTVQNIQRGLYEVSVDSASLPLGYALDPEAKTRVSIKDGEVSTVALPIQKRGQIRGTVYVDANGSDAYDRGEARPDGLTVDLFSPGGDKPLDTTATTAFGQFAFDGLKLGEFEIRVRASKAMQIAGADAVTVDLSTSEDGRRKIRVPARPADRARTVDAGKPMSAPATTTLITSQPPP